MNSKIGVLAGLLLVSTWAAADAGEARSRTIRFTAIPDHNASELKQKYDPVAAYLAAELGVSVEYVPAADYQASVEMFKNGDVQLAWFGGLTGVQARRAVPGARAIVQGAEDPNYYSYFIAHASTGLERSEEFPAGIAAFPFSFGSESSTSGRLMPEYFIRENTGKSPKEFFERPFGFSGSHPKTAELVADGTTVKAGALNYKTYDSMVERGDIDPEVCRIVWKTPYYADYNFTPHPSLETDHPIGTTDKLQAALIAMKDPDLLGAFSRSALIGASNEEFDTIEKVAKELGMVRERVR
jgi:phosphonate transport system substrate-binding protein